MTVLAPVNDPVGELADGFAPIDLEELTSKAALMSRVDRKYVLPLAHLDAVFAELRSRARVLEIDRRRAAGYRSVYFDTPQLVSYHRAATRRRRRFKIRTRTYLDTKSCWLEVKTRGARAGTVKTRVEHDPRDVARIGDNAAFVRETLSAQELDLAVDQWQPVVQSDYWRTTLFLPRSSSRMTIDADVRWADLRGHSSPKGAVRFDRHVIVETKSATGPGEGDRLLWSYGYRPVRISKYATGLAMLDRSLAATSWRRTLNRYAGNPPCE